MRFRHVGATFGKELREALRDRRTLAIMILLPLVVYPLLSMLAAQVVTSREKQREERPATVAVVDASSESAERAQLVAHLKTNPTTLVLLPAGTASDVEHGRLDVLVELSATQPATVTLVYDASREESRAAEERVSDALAKSLPDGCAPRFSSHSRDVAPRAQLGGYLLSKALPLFVVLMVLLGAFYPAIDVTAGERERGTLETVLSSPIRRFDLMLGKILAVAFLASLTGLLNLGSMAVTLMQILRLGADKVTLDIPWLGALSASLVIVPTALLFASAFVAIGATARTFKEAQLLLLPIYFVTVAPAMAGAVGDYRLAGITTCIPGMNVTLLARDLLAGHATFGGILGTLVSTVLLSAVAVAFAARVYDSERMVAPSPRRLPGSPPSTRKTNAGDAMVLFALAFLLLYFVFLPLEQRHLVLGLLVAEWLGLFGLVYLFARLSGQAFPQALGYRPSKRKAVVGAALIGCSAWVVVSMVSDWLLPVPKEMLEQLRRSLIPLDGSRGLLATLFLVAVSPAICEESLFRGPLLRGLRARLGGPAAAALTALLFGLFHLDVYRLIPSTLLGLLLGVIALESGSIVPSIIAHFCNNAMLILLVHLRLDDRMESLGHATLAAIAVASLLLSAVGVALVRSGEKKSEM
jgi:sodium transport system permease protein